jgi:hypothetical protein
LPASASYTWLPSEISKYSGLRCSDECSSDYVKELLRICFDLLPRTPIFQDPEGESQAYTPNFSMLLSQPIMQDIMLLDPSGNNDWVPDASKLGELPLLATHITHLLLSEVSFAFVAALFPHVLSIMVHKTKPCTDQ